MDNLFYLQFLEAYSKGGLHAWTDAEKLNLPTIPIWFDVDNIIPIWRAQDFRFADLPQAVPPWEMSFTEWSFKAQFGDTPLGDVIKPPRYRDGYRDGDMDRIGVLTYCVTRDKISDPRTLEILRASPAAKTWPEAQWFLVFALFVYNTDFRRMGTNQLVMSVALDAFGNILLSSDPDLVGEPDIAYITDYTTDASQLEDARLVFGKHFELLQIPFLAFSLCNCSNVKINEEEPRLSRPERRRQQKDHIPTYKYKILDIKPTTRAKITATPTVNHKELPFNKR